MKGLVSIPTVECFQSAYNLLQGQPDQITLAQWVLWTQWSRFDPRLAEQCVTYIGAFWKKILPMSLQEALLEQPWPAAAGPIFEHVLLTAKSWPVTDKKAFRHWKACVMTGISPAANEQYFIGVRALGSSLMEKDVTQSLKIFLQWGYYSRDPILNKAASKVTTTLLPLKARNQILNTLLKAKPRIQVKDYLAALGFVVSQRQAELDLRRRKDLRTMGNTKGRFYFRSRIRK